MRSRRPIKYGSQKFRPIIAIGLLALALAGGLGIRDVWIESFQQRAARPVKSNSRPSDAPRVGRLDSLAGGDRSRLADLALSVALPGVTGQVRDSKSLQLLAAQLLDVSQPLKIRRQAAWKLGKLVSQEALAVLSEGLSNAPAQLQATIAEALGNIDSAKSRAILRQLLSSSDNVVVRGAMRGWALLGDEEALRVLADTLGDSQRGADLRAEAAASLGKLDSVRAYEILIEGVNKIADPEIASSIIAGLGQRSFAETEPFFRRYLGRADVPVELKVAAMEALGQSDGNPAPLLLAQMQSDDSRIRAAAAWALATVEGPAPVATTLLAQLDRERNAEVRTRIYQALENQALDDGTAFLAAVRDDHSTARVAGLKLLAAQLAQQSNPSLAAEFDSVAVPQLERLAMNGADPMGLVSVMALKQAKTPAALQALNRIAAQSAEPKIAAAAKLAMN